MVQRTEADALREQDVRGMRKPDPITLLRESDHAILEDARIVRLPPLIVARGLDTLIAREIAREPVSEEESSKWRQSCLDAVASTIDFDPEKLPTREELLKTIKLMRFIGVEPPTAETITQASTIDETAANVERIGPSIDYKSIGARLASNRRLREQAEKNNINHNYTGEDYTKGVLSTLQFLMKRYPRLPAFQPTHKSLAESFAQAAYERRIKQDATSNNVKPFRRTR